MSEIKKLDSLKSKFIKDNELDFKIVYLSEEENEYLTVKYEGSSEEGKEKMREEYGFYYDFNTNKYSFHKKVPFEISDGELNQYMLLKLNEKFDTANKKIGIVENIAIFFFVIACIIILIFLISLIS